MRLRTDLFFILILVFAASTGVVQAQEYSANPDSSFDAPDLTVMSFNIRYDNPGDGEDAWPNRADGVAALVDQHSVDVVGLQEALPGQLADLERLLPGFAWLGVSRGGEGIDDEFSAILYRVTSVLPVDHGTFWLSETPDEPASRGWDAALPRIATWARFRLERTGDGDQAGADAPADADADADALEFLVLNTHFDHRGETARVESARLIRRWLAERAGNLPVVVTGDLNATPETDP
ncbi:MAG: endonuclease/exonuclease/phosphatase family protein, partial [Rhodothermales bacterium]|nr:endonuclease/exonuclease/phosphatase family protein [Rhodothermales bacterium]